jgi:hypothetical protein
MSTAARNRADIAKGRGTYKSRLIWPFSVRRHRAGNPRFTIARNKFHTGRQWRALFSFPGGKCELLEAGEASLNLNAIAAVMIFVLGGLVGHVITPPSVSAETTVAQISPDELTLKAGHLPVQTADAI